MAETERDARAVAEDQALEERDHAVQAEQDALEQRQEALRQAAIGLASQAELQAEGRSPETSVLLALEAVENYPYTWQAEKALGNAVLKSRLRKVIPYDDSLIDADWSSDSSQILISGGDPINDMEWENTNARVLDVSTGEELFRITDGEPTLASWSPDDRSILGLNGKNLLVKVWDVESGNARLTLDKQDIGGDLDINIVDWEPWSPNGDRFLIYNTNGLVKIFDGSTGEILQTLSGHDGFSISQVAWSPWGDLIAVTSPGESTTIVYQADNGQALYSIPSGFETEAVVFGSWSPSGDRFVTRGMGGAKVYEAITGQQLLDLADPQEYCLQAHWSPEGSKILTRDGSGLVQIWDADNGQMLHRIEDITYIVAGDWSPSGDLFLASGVDGSVYVYDARTGQLFHKLSGTFAWSFWVEFSPDGERIVAVGEDNTINVFDLTETKLYTSVPTCEWLTTPGWSPDGRQVAIGSNCPPDYPVKILDSSSGELLAELAGNKENVGGVYWSPSGDRILTTYDESSAQIWDAHNFELLFTITGPGVGHALAEDSWSPDGSRIEIPYGNGTAVIYDSSNGEAILTFAGHTRGGIQSVHWSPDGTRLISSTGQGEVLIWDATTGEVLLDLLLEDFNLEVSYSGWTNDGERVILLSEDGFVHIIDSSSGESVFEFFIRAASSNAPISLSPSEDRMIIGGYDSVASIWDIATGAEILTFDVGGVVVPAYSPDGTQVLIANIWGGGRGGMYIFQVWDSLEELVA
ncbi:MAG: PQQ-binding-like beta-propeller repeat protein, partial [Anaerolineales bacterium]